MTVTEARFVMVLMVLDCGEVGRVSVCAAVDPVNTVSSPAESVAVELRTEALLSCEAIVAAAAETATPLIFPTTVAPCVPVTSPASEPVKPADVPVVFWLNVGKRFVASRKSLFFKTSAVVSPTKVSVAAGNVIVFVPAVAVAFKVIVPEVAPFNLRLPLLNDCAAVHVWAIARPARVVVEFGTVTVAVPAVADSVLPLILIVFDAVSIVLLVSASLVSVPTS